MHLSCPHGHSCDLPDHHSLGSSRPSTCPVCGVPLQLTTPTESKVQVGEAASADLHILGGSPTAAPRPWLAPTLGDTEGPPGDPSAAAVTSWPTVAGYEILGELGRGGMGVVYKARQVRANRLVALKMILGGGHAGAEGLDRFRREAEAVARVQHPNVVQVYEVGETQGTPFFSLEFCGGGSLDHKLDGKPLLARQAAELAEALAQAVQAAHRQGIVHRDLKPLNVLLTVDGTPKVTDFGLAKQLDSQQGQTRSGSVLGTPSYMAPEQAQGLKEVGPPADVYALGAILYELLTGRPPFVGREVLDTLVRVVHEEPVPPSRLQPKVPPDLETICLKCLEKEPRKRYASAQDLADDLHRFQAGEPIRARPARAWERAVKWARRRPAVAGLLAALAAVIALGFGLVLWQWQLAVTALRQEERARADRTQAQVDTLLKANPQVVPDILTDLEPFRQEILPRLRQLWRQPDLEEAQRLRAGLALLPTDPAAVKARLIAGMLAAEDPREVLLLRHVLQPYGAESRAALWEQARSLSGKARFRALVALAAFDPDGRDWQKWAPWAVEHLLAADPLHLGPWAEALHPVRSRLLRPLGNVFRGHKLADRRLGAAVILADYGRKRPWELVQLALDADARQYAVLLPRLSKHRAAVLPLLKAELARRPVVREGAKEAQASRQANAAVTLLQLGQAGALWPLLRHTADPRRRTYLIHRLAALGVPARLVTDRLHKETKVSARRALLLGLGEYPEAELPPLERAELVPELLGLYRDDPDAGIHGAVDWLLRRWGQGRKLAGIDRQLSSAGTRGGRQWYVNGQQQTLTVVRDPREFLMGSPDSEPDRFSKKEVLHRRRIPRSFAIATKAVTVAQFDQFRKAHPDVGHSYTKRYSPDLEGPIIEVTWYEAALYCQWLSEREHLPRTDWCYPPVAELKALVKAGKPIPLPADYLQRSGYRLPTEAEWECACRAGATTAYCFGAAEGLLEEYAWYQKNSPKRTRPVGLLKPNDLGLFDMHGNVWQWCQDRDLAYPQGAAGAIKEDKEDIKLLVTGSEPRVLRGGAFRYPAMLVRCAYHRNNVPADRSTATGLRVARTYP